MRYGDVIVDLAVVAALLGLGGCAGGDTGGGGLDATSGVGVVDVRGDGSAAGEDGSDDADVVEDAPVVDATCTGALTAAEIDETTSLTNLVLSATQSTRAVGDLLHGLVGQVSNVAAAVVLGEGSLSLESLWTFEGGVYRFTTTGDRTQTTEVRFFYGPGVAGHAEGDVIDANLFAASNYLTNPSVKITSFTKSRLSYDAAGPLAPLLGIAEGGSGSVEGSTLSLASDLGSRLASITWQVTYHFQGSDGGRTIDFLITSEHGTALDAGNLASLTFPTDQSTGGWSERNQTLSVTGSSLAMLFLIPGNIGTYSFKVTGDTRFDYVAELDYGTDPILPPKSPGVTVRCLDGSLISKRKRVAYHSPAAVEAAQGLAQPLGTTSIECESVEDVVSCMGDASVQRESSATRVDVGYVIDATGSMWDDIRFVQSGVNQLTSFVGGQFPDVRFGLVSFLDGGDDYVSRVELDLTKDGAAVQQAVDGLQVGGGGDFPEAHLDALMTGLTSLRWRSDADLKVLVLVTDASFHDPSAGGNTLTGVIDAMLAQGVLVVPVVVAF